MENPIKYDVLAGAFAVWVSTLGIRHMKHFATPEEAAKFIRNNTKKCVDIKPLRASSQDSHPYEVWIENAKLNNHFNDGSQRSHRNESSSGNHAYSDANNRDEESYSDAASGALIRVFFCPACRQKIRVSIPLQGRFTMCPACQMPITLHMDDDGNLYIASNSDTENDKINLNSQADCLHALDLVLGASPEQIRSAYKKKAMQYHPDKVAKLGFKLKALAEQEMKVINTAYTKLKESGLA